MSEKQEPKEQEITELSGRFYTIEVFIVSVCSALLYYFCIGDTQSDGTIPFTTFVVRNIVLLRQILFGLVIIALIALDCEWLRYRDAKKNVSDKLQYLFCLLSSTGIMAVTYQSMIPNTRFQNIALWQLVTMIILGVIFGGICSSTRNEIRFVRTKEYAKQVYTSRIPIISMTTLVLNSTAGMLIIGVIIFINSLWGKGATFFLYLAFIVISIYFYVRYQLTFTSEDIRKYRKLIDTIDNLAYEAHIAPLLPSKLSNEETSIQQAKRITRDRFRVLNVQALEMIDVSKIKYFCQTKKNITICVNISCNGHTTKLDIPMLFVYEAFQQLQREKINNNDLLQESIFWATVFFVGADQYKNEPQTRTETITNFTFAGFQFAVSLLLSLGKCDLNKLLCRGWSPLLAAAAQGETEIAAILLSNGADPDMSNLKGITPLMYTARYNNHKTCEAILKHTPNLNMQDEYGYTAIIVAIKHNSFEVFELLLKSGADLSIKDNQGKTALDWAYKCGLGDFANKIKRRLNR